MPTISRLPVSLNQEDNDLLIELQAMMQTRTAKRLSWAEIIRISIRTQAKVERKKCK